MRIHWQRYPEQKPTGGDEAADLRNETRAMVARLNNMRIDNMAVPRDKWGYMDPVDVSTYLDMLKRLGDIEQNVQADTIYTNELIDEINNSTRGDQAHGARVPPRLRRRGQDLTMRDATSQ